MKIEKRHGSDERRILTAMIVNQTVLSRVAPKWEKGGLFQSAWGNLVGEWCVDFYDRYEEPPGKSIEGLFEAWAEGGDKETVKLVESFLSSLSDEYDRLNEEVNPEFVLDCANRHFNKVKLSRLRDALEGYIDNGELDKAQKKLDTWNRIDVSASAGVDLFNDASVLQSSFVEATEPLITYTGDLGPFFEPALTRDSLVSILASEKKGKTHWLIDMAFRAVQQRRKVAFFAVGDMSLAQMNRRFAVRAARRPLKDNPYLYPVSMDEPGEPELEERTPDGPLDWRDAHKAYSKILNKYALDGKPPLKLSVHPNSTISVHGIAAELDAWERQGWNADIIVIDYADILAPVNGSAETRDQINATWKALRALSQSRHCLVLTATQADAASYKAEVIGMSNFSEDKRKLAHVNGMFGLNQTSEEKQRGVMRLSWVVLRESEFSNNQCVTVAGCLAVGNPAILSKR